jgi:hypothetical protein
MIEEALSEISEHVRQLATEDRILLYAVAGRGRRTPERLIELPVKDGQV